MTEPTLATIGSLSAVFQRHSRTIQAALDAASIKALQFVPFGKSTMALYDKAQATAVLKAAFAPPAPAPAPAAREAPPADDRRFEHLSHQIEDRCAKILRAVEQSGAGIEQKVDTVLAGASKIADQNVLLLRAINDLRTDVFAKINALQEAFDARPDACRAPEAPSESAQVISMPKGKHNPEAPAPERAPKRRVAIIGLLKSQTQVIDKEFSSVFDLRFFESDDAKGRAFQEAVSNCASVFLMTAFANHGIDAAIRAAGSRMTRISGGISMLRDKLTALFVGQEEAVHG